MASLRILLFTTVAAVAYGVAHDLVTVRICLEYFTIGHPSLFATEDPTLLALGWGVVATWWMGAGLGILLAVAARAGRRPELAARDLVRPVLVLLLVMAAGAAVAGVVGHTLARSGAVVLLDPLAQRVPADRHGAFLTALWAHSASYLLGALGGLALAVRTWRMRGRLARAVVPAVEAAGPS